MFYLLIAKEIRKAELSEFLCQLFPEMEFHVGVSLPEFEKEGIVVTRVDFTNTYRTKIEFWLHDQTNGVALTQYVGAQMTLAFGCDTVSEVHAEGHPFDQYNSLLISGREKFVIDDDGIELDGYKPRIKYEWTKEVQQFDGHGRPIE